MSLNVSQYSSKRANESHDYLRKTKYRNRQYSNSDLSNIRNDNSFYKIIPEIQAQIFGYFWGSFKDCHNVSLVCRSWNHILQSKMTFRKFIEKNPEQYLMPNLCDTGCFTSYILYSKVKIRTSNANTKEALSIN